MPARLPFFITLQKASAECGLPYSTLRDQVVSGKVPSMRLDGNGRGKRIWVKREDIARLIEVSMEQGR